MLHPDSTRRIADIIKMANLFEEKRYHETANAILGFIQILKEKKVPSDFLEKLDSTFNLFQKEFAQSLPVGKDYRKRCFEEIKRTVFAAINRLHPNFNKALLVLYPFLKRLNHGKKITGAIAEQLNNRRITDKNVIFYLRCYAYLIFVEGIFDELARVLYFLTVVSKKNIPSRETLEKMTIWKILKKLGTKPVFLEKWNEKKHIRNSIGHARVYYDGTHAPHIIHFVDYDEKKGKSTYNRYLTMNKFAEMALELEDSVDAFIYTMILLRIYDLIISKNPYQDYYEIAVVRN